MTSATDPAPLPQEQSPVPWVATLTPSSGLRQAGLIPFTALHRGVFDVSGRGSALKDGCSKDLNKQEDMGTLRRSPTSALPIKLRACC